MSDFEDIQRLLRLKRYERPSEDFVEDFVRQFQQRQRQELLRHSARGLLWERVNTYFEGLFAPKWRWAGATAVAVVAVFFVFKPAGPGNAGVADSTPSESRKFDGPISDVEVERYLISRHFEGGLGNEHGPLVAPNLPPAPEQNRLPTGYLRQDAEVR